MNFSVGSVSCSLVDHPPNSRVHIGVIPTDVQDFSSQASGRYVTLLAAPGRLKTLSDIDVLVHILGEERDNTKTP